MWRIRASVAHVCVCVCMHVWAHMCMMYVHEWSVSVVSMWRVRMSFLYVYVGVCMQVWALVCCVSVRVQVWSRVWACVR